MDDLLQEFIAETRETLEALSGEIVAWEAHPEDKGRLDAIFRFVHTVKGSCGFLDLPRLARLSHAAEDVLAAVRSERRSADTRLVNAVLAIVVVFWPTYARVTRSLVLGLRDSNYIAASRLLGVSSFRALIREVLPNIVGPVLVLATLELGNAILLLSGLSYLGLGAVPPTPEWGAMVSYGARAFYNYWIALFPGIAIFSVVIAFNFLGDVLRDALDPRTAKSVAVVDR